MVAHALVDIEIRGRRRIEACQQLVYHDQQFHLARRFDEAFLDLFFETLGLVHRRVFRLVEMVGQHLTIDLVLAQLLGQAFAGILTFDIRRLRFVGRDDRTATGQISTLEQIVESAGRIHAIRHQKRIAVTAGQPVARGHVDENIVDNLVQPILAAHHFSQRAPALFELRTRQISQASRLGIKPLVDLGRRGQLLIDIAGFVA